MSINYILFDFDGTLIDTNEAVVSTLNRTAVHHRGTPFTESELNGIIGKPIEEQVKILSKDLVAELTEYYRSEYRKVRDDLTKAYEGMEEMLVQLKQLGLKIGIVSNKSKSGIEHGLEMLHLEHLIDISISKNDVVTPKPDPEGIFKALEGLGSDGDQTMNTIFIGDSVHDIESGKRAGCKTVLVGWTLLPLESFAEMTPDFIAYTPSELYEYIKEQMKA